MKRLPLVLITIFALAVPLFAEEKQPFRLSSLFDGSFALAAGCIYGGMNEYVYEKGHDSEMSRLEWQENFVPYLDVSGEFDLWHFFVGGGVLSAIPVKSGTLRDYDYLLVDTDEPSLFSEHDAMLDKHFEARVSLGYRFDLKRWYIAPEAGFFYRSRKWSAVDGYTQYPTDGGVWTQDTPKKDLAGTIITYEETTWMPSVAVSGGFRFNALFEVGLRAVYYPYMRVTTVDTHILRQPPTRYHDSMSGMKIFALAAEGQALFHIPKAEGLAVSLNGGWQGVFPARGTTESGVVGYDTALTESEDSQSRTESSIFWVTLGVVVYPGKFRQGDSVAAAAANF